jgi:hypothetical protein
MTTPTTSGRQERIAELEWEIAELEQADAPTHMLDNCMAELSCLRNEQPTDKTDAPGLREAARRAEGIAAAQCALASPAPSPGAQDVRERLLSAANRYDELLSNPAWKPTRAHLEDARNIFRDAFPAIAQSDAQPVGWRYRFTSPGVYGTWFFTDERIVADGKLERGAIVEPLYTASPRPDASAGLVEAAEFLKGCAAAIQAGTNYTSMEVRRKLGAIEAALRTFAADRSAPRSDKGGA